MTRRPTMGDLRVSSPTGAGTDLKAGVQRIELTLKKLSEQSNDRLECIRISSICTSGCFSSLSSLEAGSAHIDSVDDDTLESVMRLHEQALDTLAKDPTTARSIDKYINFGPDTH